MFAAVHTVLICGIITCQSRSLSNVMGISAPTDEEKLSR